PTHSHRWTVYLKGLQDEDIAYFIDRVGCCRLFIFQVEFKLHESFESPNRVIRIPPFRVTETGWGEFEIGIKIWFTDPNLKPLSFLHMLQLYHKDDNPLKLSNVVSEHYEELEFHTPSPDLKDALLAHPWEDLAKKTPNDRFGLEAQEKEQKVLQDKLEKILAEYEIIKQATPQLESELREAYEDLKQISQS
ncbi:YEATS domain-containing protein 4, partial [Kappamyces sp. JEL0680]